MELKIDPIRADGEDDKEVTTGIFVRAQTIDGKWQSVDICDLDLPSLKTWLRSRGGSNPWAESCVALILGHEPTEVSDAWNIVPISIFKETNHD